MDHSIPSRITVLDTDQDGFADRMYVGDMGGQLWRFDIINSTTDNEVEAADLVRGGVLASLGVKELATRHCENARRFYNPPDVTAMENPGCTTVLQYRDWLRLSRKPMNTAIEDRFYAIRDYLPFRAMTQDEYDDPNACRRCERRTTVRCGPDRHYRRCKSHDGGSMQSAGNCSWRRRESAVGQHDIQSQHLLCDVHTRRRDLGRYVHRQFHRWRAPTAPISFAQRMVHPYSTSRQPNAGRR